MSEMKEISQCQITNYTQADMERAAEALNIEVDSYPTLLEGMNVELEHCDLTDWTGDPIITARIALAHLGEDPNYYRKLREAGL